MKAISVSELEANTDKYIEIAQTEDVFITENGKTVPGCTVECPHKNKRPGE